MNPGTAISTVEIKVQRFVSQYGPEQLIEWLDEFEYMGGPVRFRKFKRLEKITCDAFGITIADMHNSSKMPSIDSKRVITFLSLNSINLNPATTAKLLGNISLRSIYFYVRDVETWLENPKTNKPFIETYNKICEKFNQFD